MEEPQELEPLLSFYRQRYHQMVQNSAYQDREIKSREQDISELKGQLRAAEARERKLQEQLKAAEAREKTLRAAVEALKPEVV